MIEYDPNSHEMDAFIEDFLKHYDEYVDCNSNIKGNDTALVEHTANAIDTEENTRDDPSKYVIQNYKSHTKDGMVFLDEKVTQEEFERDNNYTGHYATKNGLVLLYLIGHFTKEYLSITDKPNIESYYSIYNDPNIPEVM